MTPDAECHSASALSTLSLSGEVPGLGTNRIDLDVVKMLR